MKVDKFIEIYYKLPGYFLPYFLRRLYNKLLEKVFFVLLNKYLPNYYERTNDNPSYQLKNKRNDVNCDLIVSLTSFPARINTTHLAIESILRQTVKPDKIILWLAKSQFPTGYSELPQQLLNQLNRGLEIKFCDDLRSHKKYYFALKQYPNSEIILMDDDLFFHPHVISNLVHLNIKFPNCISSIRVHQMKFKNEKLLPYKKWHLNYNKEQPNILNHHNSGHGTLIPKTINFDSIFFNIELIKKLSFNSDDVWFKTNLIRLGIPVVTNNNLKRDTIGIKGSYKTSLVSQNTHKGLKDKQFKAVFNYFGIEPKKEILELYGK